jgi:uncharacterized surface protein with fasciclin (FAS1) repeats
MKIQSTLGVLAAALASFQTGVLSQTVVDLAVASPDHGTLVAAVLAADLAKTLSGPGPFTVFAPTDAAFAIVPANVTMLLEKQWIGHLQGILLYHVLGAKVLSTDLMNGMTATTLEGSDIVVTIPPVQINGVDVTAADLEASNGVVHVIDEVLIPPFMTTSIVDIGSAVPDFSILVELVVLAGLADALSGPGPFTLFAPTNAAFSKLDDATVAFLKDPANKASLVDILTYHVLPGIALSSTLTDGLMAKTLQGSDVTIMLDPVMVNDAMVTAVDILANNGVIHVIDTVLIPTAAPTKKPKPGNQGSSYEVEHPKKGKGKGSKGKGGKGKGGKGKGGKGKGDKRKKNKRGKKV